MAKGKEALAAARRRIAALEEFFAEDKQRRDLREFKLLEENRELKLRVQELTNKLTREVNEIAHEQVREAQAHAAAFEQTAWKEILGRANDALEFAWDSLRDLEKEHGGLGKLAPLDLYRVQLEFAEKLGVPKSVVLAEAEWASRKMRRRADRNSIAAAIEEGRSMPHDPNIVV